MNSILWNYPQVAWRSTTQNQWWGCVLTTEPAGEPISIEQAKTHLRVERTDEDGYIQSLIIAARQYCEDICGRSFLTQTWDLWLQQWPAGDRIRLLYPPIQSVNYVKYTDATETVYTVDTSVYVVNPIDDLAEVVLRFGQIWPPAVLSPSRPINIQFTSGYGADPDAMPRTIIQAMLLLIGHWYSNRESVVVSSSSAVSARVVDTVDALLTRYRSSFYIPDPLRP